MPRIKVPYSEIGPIIVVKRENGQEQVIMTIVYDVLYTATPTIGKLPTHIRIGPGASSLLLGKDTTKTIKVDTNIVTTAFEPLCQMNQLLADRKKIRLVDGSKGRFKRCKAVGTLVASTEHVEFSLCHLECSCKLEQAECSSSTAFDNMPIKSIACWKMGKLLAKGSIAMTTGFKSDTEPLQTVLTRAGRNAFDMLRVACLNDVVVVGGAPYDTHMPYDIKLCSTDYSNTWCAGCKQPFGSGLKPKRCMGCMASVLYCSKECQRVHYKHHKGWCEPEKMELMCYWEEESEDEDEDEAD